MNIEECIKKIPTLTELKRIAKPYVIDCTSLSEEEIKAALLKTAPQYSHEGNVQKSIKSLLSSDKRTTRIIALYILKHVLLQRDDYISAKKETEEEVIKWEQMIVDQLNEDILAKSGERTSDLKFMQFILRVAWDNNDELSSDEKNLIEKIRERLKVTSNEFRIIEADLGKFPKHGNELHTRGEIEDVRKELQARGLIFNIRNKAGNDFDVIPDEIAQAIRSVLKVEIRNYGYSELLKYKTVRSKPYLKESLAKDGIKTEKNPNLETLTAIVIEQLSPRVLLGGTSPKDGLSMKALSEWCSDLSKNTTGTKKERINRIIEYYDALHERDDSSDDKREIFYKYINQLAKRDREFLRNQKLVEKDIEIERKFEEATNYLFEKRLGHKPLKMSGTNHADGSISHKDKIILWDNKSKETPVNLKDHFKQFYGYIKQSDRPVAGFLVIGPDFTPESSSLAMKYKVENGVIITMIKASEMKDLAERWHQKSKGEAFPLEYLIQTGRFNPDLVKL